MDKCENRLMAASYYLPLLSADDPAAMDPGSFLFALFYFLIEGFSFFRRKVIDGKKTQIGKFVSFLHLAVIAESRCLDIVQHLIRIAYSHPLEVRFVLFGEPHRQIQGRCLVDRAAHESDFCQIFIRDFIVKDVFFRCSLFHN